MGYLSDAEVWCGVKSGYNSLASFQNIKQYGILFKCRVIIVD